MKLKYIFVIIFVVILVVMLSLFFKDVVPTTNEQNNAVIESYRIEKYLGLVIDKYIDKEEHNYKKVIINENYKERVIIFNHEDGGLFDFLEIGDSIIKTEGSLKVLVVREDSDTTINMKFTNI